LKLKLKRNPVPVPVSVPAPQAAGPPPTIDPETGLLLLPEFGAHLEREISRGQRYGNPSALALFDIRVAVSEEHAGSPLPSPARHIADILKDEARTSDIAARLDLTSFAVLLINADSDGARSFTERCRTRIGSEPYFRDGDGLVLYARAWAGVTDWHPGIETPEQYVDAAVEALERTFSGYEAAQSWFRGESTYQPK
jgi:GGDEF domain-containing protein